MIEENPAQLHKVVSKLENRSFPVFDRIILHLLRRYAPHAPAFVAERLSIKTYFESEHLQKEYAALLEEQFVRLEEADRERILCWIKEGPDIEQYAARVDPWTKETPTDEMIDRYVERYRLNRLWPIREHLPESWRERFNALLERFGPPVRPEFHMRDLDAATLEDHSPIALETLKVMPIEEIVQYVERSATADAADSLATDGLRLVLMKAVAEQAERFADGCGLFLNSPPLYRLGVIQGLREAVLADQVFAWQPVLDLCLQLAEATECADIADEGAIAELLRAALERDPVPIPIEERTRVWTILERLLKALKPDRDGFERSNSASLEQAAFSLTPRCRLLDCMLLYGFWVRRDLANRSPGSVQTWDAIPEVRQVFEDHCDPVRYPFIALRAYYCIR